MSECAGTCGLERAGRGLYCDGCGECWPNDGSVVLTAEQVAQVRGLAEVVQVLTEAPGNELPDEVFNLMSCVLALLDGSGE